MDCGATGRAESGIPEGSRGLRNSPPGRIFKSPGNPSETLDVYYL